MDHRKQPFIGVLKKTVLKICSKFTGEHPCRSVISIKLLYNFTEIALRNGCSSVNLLHIFRIPFYKNTYEWLLLDHEKSDAAAGSILWKVCSEIRFSENIWEIRLMNSCFNKVAGCQLILTRVNFEAKCIPHQSSVNMVFG